MLQSHLACGVAPVDPGERAEIRVDSKVQPAERKQGKHRGRNAERDAERRDVVAPRRAHLKQRAEVVLPWTSQTRS